jgi:oligopeptide/dipeptide ABC transporter ATP-binding protein
MAEPPLLRAEGVSVRFRALSRLGALLRRVPDPHVFAVHEASFALGRGETLGIVGESGSGKTSLIRALTGLVDLNAGNVWFEGASVLDRSEAGRRALRRQISMMFQDPVASLSPRKTVRSLVLEPFRIHGEAPPDLEAEARALLAMVGLPAGLLGAYPHQLSGGQARRVGIARALALRPKLIVADEPTAGLDVSVQGEVLNLMNQLQADLGLSFIIVTHNLPVIRHASDRLAVMYLGRFVEEGPTGELFAAPRHPYTQALMRAVPQPDPDRRRGDRVLMGEVPSLLRRPSGCEFHPRCPVAQARCRIEPPALRAIALGRRVSCHFPIG